MGDRSKIEWTDASWNPIRGTLGNWHCVKVSPACAHCYAEAFNKRLGGPAYTKGADALRLDEKALQIPMHWKKPRRIFVCSMTDLFAEDVPDEWIDRVFAVMALNPRHTFHVLTKRAARMRAYFDEAVRESGRWDRLLYSGEFPWPDSVPDDAIEDADRLLSEVRVLPNVWLGVTVEDQQRADERIPHLLLTPAAVRWLSCEPLLGPVDLQLNRLGYRILDWVVCGGESGPAARPMQPDWARSLRDQCATAGVPFFFKQWGGPMNKKDAAYKTLDGQLHEAFPDEVRA